MESLTQDVHLYNRMRRNLKNPSRSKQFINLEKSILYRCQLIIYQSPMETKLLDPEHCAEFLLVCMPYMLTIVRNFKDRGVPFEAYLRKIIRIRARTFYSKKRLQQYKERTLLYCCGKDIDGIVVPAMAPCQNRLENSTMEGVDIYYPNEDVAERWNLYSRYRTLRVGTSDSHSSELTADAEPSYGETASARSENESDASTLFNRICSRPQRAHRIKEGKRLVSDGYPDAFSMLEKENPSAARLQQTLRSPMHRRRLLTLLLSTPGQITPSLINYLSSIMDIDEYDLAQLVRKANDATLPKQQRKAEMRRIINGHWKRRIWLDQQLYTLKSTSGYDRERGRRLEKEHSRARTVLQERREEYSRSPEGLSCMELSQLLDIPKGTVCSRMYYARRMLQECLRNETLNDNECLAGDRQTSYSIPHGNVIRKRKRT